MPTNDGYSPYPIGLTAQESIDALNRAKNLSDELASYVKYTSGSTPPIIYDTKDSDLWLNTNTSKLYRASIDGTTLIWFEV